jgi:hydroxymethylbilane synthase
MTSQSLNSRTFRIGTRASRLARWQASWVAEQLRGLNPGLTLDLVEIKTHGDRDGNSSLANIGWAGSFTKDVQQALRERSVDLAVHSLKDLPTETSDDLMLAAIPAREDAADALVAPEHQTLYGLPPRSLIGTGSPRRRAQLLFLRPDLRVVTLRGNVETRLRRAVAGRLDAVLLALAGLRRLGLERYVTERLEPSEFLPAPGQGALALECRRDDVLTQELLKSIDEPVTHGAVRAERAALAALQGGCAVPIAAWARQVESNEIHRLDEALALDAAVFNVDGRARLKVSLKGARTRPEDLGCRVAEMLRSQGAVPLMRNQPC